MFFFLVLPLFTKKKRQLFIGCTNKVPLPPKGNRSAVLQIRERGLRTVLVLREQADDKGDGVPLNGYEI